MKMESSVFHPTRAAKVKSRVDLGCFLLSNPPPPPLPANKVSQRRHTLKNLDNSDKPADGSIPGINGGSAISVSSWRRVLATQSPFAHLSAALDGVPFSLHPNFDMKVKVTVGQTHADRLAAVYVPHHNSSVFLSGSEFSIKRHSH